METSLNQPKISVLMCAWNEADTLPLVLPRIPAWVNEVVLVDGHSVDGTVEIARSLRNDIRVVYQPGKGKGDAVRYGISQCHDGIIVMLDADGETDPQEMDRFVSPLYQGYDFVKGSRFHPGFFPRRAVHRALGALALTGVFNILFLCVYTDITSGYNAFWSKAIKRLDLGTDGDFATEPVLLARARKAGLKMKEVGHKNQGRLGGVAKVPTWWKHGAWILKTVIYERFHG